MNQVEYMNRLAKCLTDLPPSVQTEIISEQREHFEAAVAEGRSPDEVARSMGDPEQIAKAYRAQIRIDGASSAKGVGDTGIQFMQAVFALLVLTPFNLIFVLGPVVALLGILLGFFGAGIGLFGGGFGAGVSLPFILDGDWGLRLASLFTGLGISALGLAWLGLTLMATRATIDILLRYFQLNLQLIKGTKKGSNI